MQVNIYRFNPETDVTPWTQSVEFDVPKGSDMMVLDLLESLKVAHPTLSFRRSCREGVCGSDAINMNGRNGLACITPVSEIAPRGRLTLLPLPGLPVIRDLIVDLEQFYNQYKRMEPWLKNDTPPPEQERLQSPEERAELDGLYECILCACCSSSCPSYWWNPDKFVGPAGLLQAYRFIADSRDQEQSSRLEQLKDAYSLYRCRGIMNCVSSCPKGLNPTAAIGKIRTLMLSQDA